ncbi:MAG: hypothetical protein D6818_08985, partial [Bacteroidetes bacterium]
GNYRFEQRATKFQVASFGLPEFDARPVVAATPERPTTSPQAKREKPKEKAAAAAAPPAQPASPDTKAASPSAPTPPPAVEEEEGEPLGWLYRIIPLLLILALAVVLFSIYLVYFKGEDTEAVPSAPAHAEQPVPQDEPEDVADFAEETTSADEGAPDTEAPTPPPDQRETFVVLHSFGKERNAARFAERLVNDGYNAASVQDGRLIRVGVRFAWRDSSELQSMIETLGKQYKTTPKVWEAQD